MANGLEVIYWPGGAGHPVATQRLTEAPTLSGSSVANMAKRLHEPGLVNHERGRDVTMTSTCAKISPGTTAVETRNV